MADLIFPTILLAVAVVFGLSTAWAGLSGAPWVPTRRSDVQRVFDAVGIRPGETIVDLGSGDGRLVIRAVKQYGATGIGYELSTLMILVSRFRALRAGLRGRVRFVWRNAFRVDLRSADVVTCFFLPKAMPRLEKKLAAELKPGARFLSVGFPLPERRPSAVIRENNSVVPLYLYRF